MGTQLPLDFFRQRSKLERAFWDFHFQHPEVYEHLLLFAREWRSRRGDGARLGIAMLFERVRWELHLQLGDDIPKLNNNHRAFYARLLMERHPELDGMFSLSQQREPTSFGPDNGLLHRNRQCHDV